MGKLLDFSNIKNPRKIISVFGVLFDVSHADDGFYGERGSYKFLIGHESTNALGHMKTEKTLLDNFEGLENSKKIDIARELYDWYIEKRNYQRVGWLKAYKGPSLPPQRKFWRKKLV